MASDSDDGHLVKLVQVKRGIYNPYQPTFLQKDLDRHLGRLHDDQRATTLPKGVEDYPQDVGYQYRPPCTFVKGYSVLPVYKSECLLPRNNPDISFLEHCKWADFRRRVPLADKRVTGIASIRENKVMNFCARQVSPEIGESWRYKFPGSGKTDGKFVDRLFPEFAPHTCPCLEPRKPVPGTELCQEPLPATEPEPEGGVEHPCTQPHEPVDSCTKTSCAESDNASQRPQAQGVCGGQRNLSAGSSTVQGTPLSNTIPCPTLSRPSHA